MEPLELSDLDPLAGARAVAELDGTVLLHTQRPWYGTGRSFLLFDPVWALRVEAGRIVDEGPVPRLARPASAVGTRLEQLRGLAVGCEHPELPFLAGYIGYETGSSRAGARHPVAPPFRLPDARIGAYDGVLEFGGPTPPRLFVRDLRGLGGDDPVRRQEELVDRLLRAPGRTRSATRTGAVDLPDPGWHRAAMDRIAAHLQAGDTYQVNLTGFARAETTVEPFEHYSKHSQHDPVAFAAYLRAGDATITSHSPERLLEIRRGLATTAPIKGTRAIAPGAGRALRASGKDRAEHLMIVDLCRNDLGRRAVDGTVRVAGLMEPLEVRGIVHLVSRIQARVRPGARGALLDSLLPGGSITGAPKRRAMEIIRDVETCGRGPYTGSIGYVTPGGDLDFSIAIRTAVWQDDAVHFGCGGGIVVDSDPAAEYAEAVLKARSFFDSLGPSTTGAVS